jgi:NADH dehydrogenase
MRAGFHAQERPRVVIVGAGFGGLAAATALRDAPVDVTLIDRNNFHTFQPLLYQVATAALEPEEIAYPVRDALRRAPNLDFRLGEVEAIDVDAGRLRLADGGEVEFDYLVVAAGSTTSDFGVPGVAEHAIGLKSIEDATAIRSHFLAALEQATVSDAVEERRRLMRVLVVGGGPTGVELVGSLAELLHSSLADDFPSLPIAAEGSIVLIEATDALLGTFPRRLQLEAARRLRRLGVEIRYASPVKAVTPAGVELASGELLVAGTVVWVAGVRAAGLANRLALPKAGGGRVSVTETLQVDGKPNVYLIGDLAALPKPLPMLAPVAIQQGRLAAANILRQEAGRPPKRFVYKDRGTMATIGRSAAVAKIGPLQLSGFLAWLLWLTIHLVWLIGFRNRALVLTNWAWSYILNQRGVRLIMPTRGGTED